MPFDIRNAADIEHAPLLIQSNAEKEKEMPRYDGEREGLDQGKRTENRPR